MKKCLAILLTIIFLLTSCANSGNNTDNESNASDATVYTLTPQVPKKNGAVVQNIYDVDGDMHLSGMEGFVIGNNYVVIRTPEAMSDLLTVHGAEIDKIFDKEFFENHVVVATLRADEIDFCFAEVTYTYTYDAEKNELTLKGEYAAKDDTDCNGLVTSCIDIVIVPKTAITGIEGLLSVKVEHPKAASEQKQKHIRTILLDRHSTYPETQKGYDLDDMPIIGWKGHADGTLEDNLTLKSYSVADTQGVNERLGVINDYASLKEVFERESGLSIDEYYSSSICDDHFFLVIVRATGGVGSYASYSVSVNAQTKELQLNRTCISDIISYTLDVGSEGVDFVPVPRDVLSDVEAAELIDYTINLVETTKNDYFN